MNFAHLKTLGLLALLLVCGVAAELRADDFEVIGSRLRSNFLAKKQVEPAKIRELCSSLRSDGTWSDINYQSTDRGSWAAADHLDRTLLLAAAWGAAAEPRDPGLTASLRRALDYWCAKDLQNSNWWWNEISVPRKLVNLLTVADGALTPQERAAALKIIRRAKISMIGQNRVWLSEIVFKRAVLERNRNEAFQALGEILNELRISDKAGIRPDGSFHQHGPQIQFGNYGLSFLQIVADWSCVLKGTSLQYTPEQWRALDKLILEGYARVIWLGRMDYLAVGRQLGPDSRERRGRRTMAAIEKLAVGGAPRSAEYLELVKNNRAKKVSGVGNYHFYLSDYMVHRRPGWYASVRMNSVKTRPVEDRINGDNSLGRFFSDGATQVMLDGGEYKNTAAIWDWTRLPGTTLPAVPILDREECRRRGIRGNAAEYPRRALGKYRNFGESVFSGGVSDGRHGVAVYSMNLDKVKAKKAYFFDDEAVYELGCDIWSASPYPVATTLECNLLKGEVKSGKNWVWHRGVGYAGENFAVRTEKKSGDWRIVVGGAGATPKVSKKLFTVTIDHGVRPSGASYVCAILPNRTPDAVAAWKNDRVLSNTGRVQAVKFADGTIGAVFHQSGKLGDFRAERSGLYLIGSDGYWFADPAAKQPSKFFPTSAAQVKSSEK